MKNILPKKPVARKKVPAVAAVPQLPPLSTSIGECFLVIEGLGKTRSDMAGDYTIAQRLGFAHAKLTRTRDSFIGIAERVEKAFELIEFNQACCSITARLRTTCPVMMLKAVDPEWLVVSEQRSQATRIFPGPVSTEHNENEYGSPRRRSLFGEW